MGKKRLTTIFCFFALLFFWPSWLFATKGYLPTTPEGRIIAPWFTGPLFTPSPTVVPGGHFDLEPSLFGIGYTASYDNDWDPVSYPIYWTVATQLKATIGILSWLDFHFTPIAYWNYTEGHARWEYGDTNLKLAVQLHLDQLPHKSWLPSIKFSVNETIPTGKYRNLNPKLLETDLGGQGSWITGFQLTFGKEIHCYADHFFSGRLSLLCNVGAPIHLKGFNAYGGSARTNGMYYPGITGEADLGLEYSLTRNWALALDIIGIWAGSSRFKENNLAGLGGVEDFYSVKANIQYTLAPAIEYNWSNNLGIIAGAWFTAAGKNSSKFASGVIQFNYYR